MMSWPKSPATVGAFIARAAQAASKARVKWRLKSAVPLPVFKENPEIPKILVLAPEAGIHAHFHTCCVLAKTLRNMGHKVVLARCFDQLSRCPVKANAEASAIRNGKPIKDVCETCVATSFKAADNYALDVLDLRSLEDAALRKEYNEAEKNLANTDLASFCYEGVPLGAMCAYEVRLGLKALTLDQTDPEVRRRWSALILTAVKLYLLTKAAARLGFSHLVYFNDYSFFLAARFAMEASGGSACMVTHAYHRGVDRSRWILNRSLGLQLIYTDCLEWPQWRDLPLTPVAVTEITSDAIYRFSGRSAHTYSPPRSAGPTTVSVDGNKKLIVVFTSSPDESASIDSLAAMGKEIPSPAFTFGSKCEDCQISWLTALQAFARANNHLEFVVRIHPREGANKREAGNSEHLAVLRKILASPPKNFTVYWPQDVVSSYDLVERADLVLTSWSTLGLESARLGVPVLACARGVAGYPVDDFQEFVESEEQYFKTLHRLLRSSPSLDTISRAYRWWHFTFLSSGLDLSDVISSPESSSLPENLPLPAAARDIETTILSGYSKRSSVKARLQSVELGSGRRDEAEALKVSLKRLIMYFLTGEDREQNYWLVYTQSATGISPQNKMKEATNNPDTLHVLVKEHGSEIKAVGCGLDIDKNSPLLRRLCSLVADEKHLIHGTAGTRTLDALPMV